MHYWSVWFSYEQISVNMLHCGEYGAYVLPRVLALLRQDQLLAIFLCQGILVSRAPTR